MSNKAGCVGITGAYSVSITLLTFYYSDFTCNIYSIWECNYNWLFIFALSCGTEHTVPIPSINVTYLEAKHDHDMRQPPINKHYGHIFGQKHRLCQLLIHIVTEYDWIQAQLALNLWEQWWDPILPIHITNHVWHFCDDLGWFMLKDDKGQQKVTLCNHLWCLIPFYNTLQCTLLHLRPFLTFSDAFGSFVTFLDFTLFNTPDSFYMIITP